MLNRKTKDILGYLFMLLTMPVVIILSFIVFLGIPMAIISGMDYVKGVFSALGFVL